MNGLQYAERIARRELPSPPVARLIGFEVVSIEPGRAVIGLDASARHANPMGTLHGGILGDIADAAMGMAYATGLADGEAFTTLELKINFLRPVWNARLTATGTIKQRGQTVGLVECDVTDERGRLVAHASSTCMTLRGEKADGRRVTAEGSAPDPVAALVPNTLDLTTSLS